MSVELEVGIARGKIVDTGKASSRTYREKYNDEVWNLLDQITLPLSKQDTAMVDDLVNKVTRDIMSVVLFEIYDGKMKQWINSELLTVFQYNRKFIFDFDNLCESGDIIISWKINDKE